MVGTKPTEVVHFMGRDRPYEDGGGKCSPGRWPRRARRLPEGINRNVIPVARKILEGSCGGESDLLSIMLAMAAGGREAPPFEEAERTFRNSLFRPWVQEKPELNTRARNSMPT